MNREYNAFEKAVIAAILFAFFLFVAAGGAGAQTVHYDRQVPKANQLAPIVVQLDGIPTSSLVTMLLRDIMRVPYVITPDVLADRRPTSVRLVIPRNQVPQHVVTYLRRSGYTVSLVGGTVYVGRNGGSSLRPAGGVSSAGGGATALQNPGVLAGSAEPSSSVPMGSPVDLRGYTASRDLRGPVQPAPAPPPPAPVSQFDQAQSFAPQMPAGMPPQMLVFLPAHRETSYLAQMVGDVLPGLKFGAAGAPKADTLQSEIQSRTSPDVLVMTGPVSELAAAKQLLPMLDRPRPMVAVKAVVMSVQENSNRGSALSILASFAKGRVSVGSFNGEASGGQFVRIATGALTAVLSAVREDSRFKVVATPNLAALSGAVASMNSGAQVPIVGAVSIAEGGTPVQSIEYRDSGITLTVRPIVRGDLIELDVKEERSTFVRTTTGVSDSPTLQRSAASASVVLKNGESVALAGLTEEGGGTRREGLLGGLLGVRGREKQSSQLVVMLSAEIVPPPSTVPGVFLGDEAPQQDGAEGTEADRLAVGVATPGQSPASLAGKPQVARSMQSHRPQGGTAPSEAREDRPASGDTHDQ